MDKFVIKGGKQLSGTVEVSGAKNSALALMPAVLLNNGVNTIDNVPEVNDIFTMMKLLRYLGVNAEFSNNKLVLDSSNIVSQDAPYKHVKKMRASVYVLGPLLSKYGYAKVSMPGGCAWGPRPINLHLEAMKKFGASIELEEGYIIAKTNRLSGARINFDISSVGATGNALMAAVLAKGESIITNAASEPEITQLAEFLTSMGAKINGIGSNILEIEGVETLSACSVVNIPDRIEAGTLLIAGAMTRGKIKLANCNSKHLNLPIQKLEDSGAKLFYNNEVIEIDSTNMNPKGVNVTTAIYPGFPTDLQAQWTAYMCTVNGSSKIVDTIYLDRFKHIPELNRLGANIEMSRNSAIVKGVDKLKGATVMSTDLRASASLVLAGLVADGTTNVLRIYHIDRGYQKIEEKLTKLGADITRVKTEDF
ncbi:MAG: UDP-N-acetylglucosamine 1-carboxyvinyltransferase [Ignavibacteriae bacterium]|nr:MAG: UDP-N-acetylglucosamine 1-carboxyvinyltransferase [Ignavibacteriota bacterium]